MKILGFSKFQLVLTVFFMYYLQELLGAVTTYMYALHALNPADSGHGFTWGYFLKYFYLYDLIPLLLVVMLLTKHFKFKWPDLRPYQVSMLATLTLTGVAVGSILSEGFTSHMHFLGYYNLNVSVLVYCGVALYLLYVFRGEPFLETLLFVVLGVLVVGELWELPLNLAFSELPLLIAVPAYLQRYIPLFFWFLIFRGVYSRFLVEKWHFAAFLVLSIGTVTARGILSPMSGFQSAFAGLYLHLAYAALLVFLPFHYYVKKEVKK